MRISRVFAAAALLLAVTMTSPHALSPPSSRLAQLARDRSRTAPPPRKIFPTKSMEKSAMVKDFPGASTAVVPAVSVYRLLSG